ncbi:MAG: glycosyltransferase [Bacteroidota bacterium]
MNSRTLHMVCLRSPFPANTGGARDMFDRLEALHQSGIVIHLHYFTKGDEAIPSALKQLCDKIYQYPRKLAWKRLLTGQPYIVACRADADLFARLAADNAPILFDGVHTTAHLGRLMDANRKIVVRMHNDESDYYLELARYERNIFRRFYFLLESYLLRKWMRRMPAGVQLGCIQSHECETIGRKYPNTNTFLLPPSIPVQVHAQTGKGGYCLYHGNLSIGENERAAIWLLRRVFAQIKLPLVITGKSPSAKLEKLVHFYQHTCLVANPTADELIDLISKAQINVLPSKTQTGIKMKVFDAIQYGRHCVINQEMAANAPWTDSCRVVSNADEMGREIEILFQLPITTKMIEDRQERLDHWRTKLDPAEALIKRLW